MDIPDWLSFFPFPDWSGKALSCWMKRFAWINLTISMWKVNHKLTSLKNSYFNAGFRRNPFDCKIPHSFNDFFPSEGADNTDKLFWSCRKNYEVISLRSVKNCIWYPPQVLNHTLRKHSRRVWDKFDTEQICPFVSDESDMLPESVV